MTFFEEGTKMTYQLHISKFKVLSFLIKKKKLYHRFYSSDKCVTSRKRQKVNVFVDFIEETKDFKF